MAGGSDNKKRRFNMKTEVKNYDGEPVIMEHDGSTVAMEYIEEKLNR